jgi:branched-chain amino acid transport system substrate-binding protein
MPRRAPVALAALCLGLTACGGDGGGHSVAQRHKPQQTHRPPPIVEVDVYSSLPLQGPDSRSAKAIENGINLALWEAHDQAGVLKISYTPLDDATRASDGWNQQRTLRNAMRAAADKKAVFYIGEFNSAASEFSIPILNQAGLAQVGPGSGYIGLTSQVPSVRDATLRQQPNEPDEPARYYPAGPDSRNFVRLIPSDVVQAAAGVQALKKVLGCTRVALVSDTTQHGISLAALIRGSAPMYGLSVGAPTQIKPNRTDFRKYVEDLKTHDFNCLSYSGRVTTAAVDLVREIHLMLPSMPVLGSEGVCSEKWTKPRIGGTETAIDPLMYCTSPALPFKKYPGGRSLLGLYHHLYGTHANPNPWAIYGYEAMELGIDTIAQLGRNGANRAAVRQALFTTIASNSVLGSYTITPSGETTLTSYGLYKTAADGGLHFSRVLNPAPRILTTT